MKPLTGRETFGETRFSAHDTGNIDLYIDEYETVERTGWKGKEIVFLFAFFSFGKKSNILI